MCFCFMQPQVHVRVANILPELPLLLDKLDPQKWDVSQWVFLGPDHMAIPLQAVEGPGYCTILFHLQPGGSHSGKPDTEEELRVVILPGQ